MDADVADDVASDSAEEDGAWAGGDLERRGAGWGEPERLPAVVNASPNLYSPSVAADGSIYYTSGGHDYVCARRNGRYLPAELIEVPGICI